MQLVPPCACRFPRAPGQGQLRTPGSPGCRDPLPCSPPCPRPRAAGRAGSQPAPPVPAVRAGAPGWDAAAGRFPALQPWWAGLRPCLRRQAGCWQRRVPHGEAWGALPATLRRQPWRRGCQHPPRRWPGNAEREADARLAGASAGAVRSPARAGSGPPPQQDTARAVGSPRPLPGCSGSVRGVSASPSSPAARSLTGSPEDAPSLPGGCRQWPLGPFSPWPGGEGGCREGS